MRQTSPTARAATNETGYYEVSYLKPGNYTLRVTNNGFKAAERKRVELRVEDRNRLDFTLELGDVSTSVAVTDAVPPVQSESSSLGQVVSERSVKELPMAGRNVFLELSKAFP